jgi:hypothetical protein
MREPRRALRRQLEEYEVGVRWWPACEDVITDVEGRPLLEAATKHSSENTSLCVIVSCQSKPRL